MWARFVNWLGKTLTLKQAVVIFAFCMLISASFAFGAAMGRQSLPHDAAPIPRVPPAGGGWGVEPFGQQTRGTFGAIDEIEGDVIQIRDPRSGKTWRVRAGDNTVIEYGRHRRIPFDNLRVGQRIFVVGVPGELEASNEVDAQFIGVVLGQQQKFARPAQQPVSCWDCTD
jgi:hypothetical protein